MSRIQIQSAGMALMVACMLFILPALRAQDPGPSDWTQSAQVREAVRMAVKEAVEKLASSGVAGTQPISLLPIAGDLNGYIEGVLKVDITGAKLAYVEGSDSPIWGEILKEVEWSERKSDMLDPATLVKFGKLQGTKLLLYGALREASDDGRKAFVELELHLSSIETKRHLWGMVVVKRVYRPGADQPQGMLELDEAGRKILQTAVNSGAASLRTALAGKAGLTVAVVPLAGDMDRYVTELTGQMLTKSGAGITVRELGVKTVGETRLMLAEQPDQANTILAGALRDLYKVQERETIAGTEFRIGAEVQLKLIDAKTGAILWGDTLRASDKMTEQKQSRAEETGVKLIRDWPEKLLWGAGILVGILVLIYLFRIMIRPR